MFFLASPFCAKLRKIVAACVYFPPNISPIFIKLSKLFFRFEEFDLEASSNGDCRYDYLAVYDGDSINSRLIGRYCGSAIPESVKSVTNTMTVQFVTDSSVTKGGFRAIYTESYGEFRNYESIMIVSHLCSEYTCI